ncbi:MAG: nickel pincer cofactor biosynthesis protein LarC [Deltaproteobacteria bacterium]|uniref:Putative nickel insertion protein n=1 Tax=Candidatus Desulfacyla euxinica TaxID=2841693 RepID=A0A8J6N1F4_9DELT|nr:nickel pincer cofactor biosynthesis protein LarC [Candidatus Desulfacyla euxinica]
MKVAYFDCFAGASGDMILGALMDAGLELELLKGELAKLHLTHYDLQVKKVAKRGIGGSQALVSVDEDHHHHHHRHLHDIEEIIDKSDLKESIKRKSIEIFTRLAEAEAKVHQTTIEQIHFHEVGAMDAIIDVVGAVAGLAALGIEKVYCSPLHVGTGTVECAHGTLPVPAPATAELIRGKPIYSTGVEGELLTPTGAAILTTLSSGFGPMPSMTLEEIGYGAGTSEPAIPNLLRVAIGEVLDEVEGYKIERTAVIETSIDDMNPEVYDYLIHKMLDMGALDVFLAPLQMKKNRPGTMVTVICVPENVGKFSDFLMRETTTIGLRWRVDNRIKARRTTREVQTKYGTIKFKVAQVGDTAINVSPEYEDCKRAALERKVPLKEVMEEVRAAALGIDFTGQS